MCGCAECISTYAIRRSIAIRDEYFFTLMEIQTYDATLLTHVDRVILGLAER